MNQKNLRDLKQTNKYTNKNFNWIPVVRCLSTYQVTFSEVSFYWLGDGAVDVGDDYFVVVPPAEHVALAARRALVRSGHAEHHLIHSLAKVQIFLMTKNK